MARHIRVILVDNDPDALERTSGYLESARFSCFATADPREAYAVIRRKPKKVDLLVTDFVMDPFTGLDLVRKLREDLIGVPVILVSADIHSGLQRGAREVGVEHLLPKPVERTAFLAAVQDVLGSRAHGIEGGLA